MAKSPSHKWGQIIGDFLEEFFKIKLAEFAATHNLYLDTQGVRPARKGKKVSWIDSFENKHDLDFVLERKGTKKKIGDPVAFIESAWRRYTKHSRNKAQEIQGAILPLVATHKNFAPFIGVLLAGEFTGGALTQMKSLGFNVLHFPYDLIVKSFKDFGLDAAFDEDTTTQEFQRKIDAWEKFQKKNELGEHTLNLNRDAVNDFFINLEKTVSRYISSVYVVPLHGEILKSDTVKEAIQVINEYSQKDKELTIFRYEIIVHYNNGDKVEAEFKEKSAAIEFLESYAPPKPNEK